jgi:hypothetical protein
LSVTIMSTLVASRSDAFDVVVLVIGSVARSCSPDTHLHRSYSPSA